MMDVVFGDFAVKFWWDLMRRLMDVQLSDEPDTINWKLSINEIFFVKSM